MNRLKNILKYLLTISLIGGTVYFCYFTFTLPKERMHHDEAEEEDHPEDRVSFSDVQQRQHGISIRRASGGIIKQSIRAPGQISMDGNAIVHLLPKVSGIVVQAEKNIGDSIQQNEVLAVLESREIAEAKSAYLTALRREELTNKIYDREYKLFHKHASTEQEFQAAEAAEDTAMIELQLTKQKLFAIGLTAEEIQEIPRQDPQSLRRYEIRSPLAGTVIKRHLVPGELVDIDHEIYEIANLENVWIEFAVYPKDLPLMVKGQAVQFKDGSERTGSGHILHISPAIDQNTRKAFAIAQVDNRQGKWSPGLFVEVEVPAGEKRKQMLVPKTALQKIEGQQCLFVINNEGFDVRAVTVGDCDDKNVEILSGLKQGDLYASDKTFILKAELKKHEAEHMD